MDPVTLYRSASAATRLAAVDQFLDALAPAAEALVIGATRDAVDDLVRDRAARRGATFGLHRFSLRQLAARITATHLAARGLAPATRLGAEAVAARAAFDELEAGTLSYLSPIARLRSFGRTLASSLDELRVSDVDTDDLDQHGALGTDLARLAARYAEHLKQARLIDIPELYRLAAATISSADAPGLTLTGGLRLDVPVLLVDVPVRDEATRSLVCALARRASRFLATVPLGDDRTIAGLARVATTTEPDDPSTSDTGPLAKVRERLFEPIAVFDASAAGGPAELGADEAVSLFSAPGETRECVEIARAVHEQARRGVPLDRMAVLLRAPQVYAPLLETALRRAGVDAWFVRGTRAPDPAGRAFLALLACAAERLSARRFSEYLSLGQVPAPDADGAPPLDRSRWVPPDNGDQLLPPPVLQQGSLFDLMEIDTPTVAAPSMAPDDTGDTPVVDGTLRTPWRWDRLLVESAVIGGHDRWTRRLAGLEHELELRLEAAQREDPESSRVARLASDITNVRHLRRFALPVIDRLGAFPASATWGEWLDRLDTLAPMVLQRPDRVLAVLGELRPMAAVGPVPLAEVQNVLSERLTQLHEDPPSRRYGRVFVGGPEHVRGRVFDVVFVPGLAERIFPQKQRQDPLLLDEHRRTLNGTADGRLGLPVLADRVGDERLLLRLAVGAATQHLYLSYPRLQLGESRPRVPSFYALDLERARTGRVPDFAMTERRAFARVGARLAWPAPSDPGMAIDDTEHDLSVLGPLLRRAVSPELTGRARYLLELNPGLRRSLLTRWARWMPAWTKFDGIYHPEAAARAALDQHRLSARPYSVSALQRFAVCPYQFLLSSIFRLHQRDEIESLERLDPLTRGRMFHEIQAAFVRGLEARGALPVTRDRLAEAETLLDDTLDTLAARYREELAPAIDRVWIDEVEAMRTDLKGWVHHVANEEGEWVPVRAELGFGFAPGAGRDPRSVPEPAVIDGQWQLHGIVDLVEARGRPTAEGELRVTDHKTGKNRTQERMIVGRGEVLQPVLYGLAVEQSLGRPVAESRLFYSTVAGGYGSRTITLGDTERRHGLEVLEIIDRAIEHGVVLPAPRQGACTWCDFRVVCGPWEETRVRRKDSTKLADLQVLRRLP
ncbi:MAG: PD-(D/E)XK nuclease family protein [Acidobacteria bacterium]|nr:PD-(D/E)XK nuclease family protein [Acidobacteriota bacterium]